MRPGCRARCARGTTLKTRLAQRSGGRYRRAGPSSRLGAPAPAASLRQTSRWQVSMGTKSHLCSEAAPPPLTRASPSPTPDTVPQPEPAGPSREEAARGSELGPALRLPGCWTPPQGPGLCCSPQDSCLLKEAPWTARAPGCQQRQDCKFEGIYYQSPAPAPTVT